MKASHSPEDGVNGIAAVGDVILYNIATENTGNVDMTGTTVTDPMFKITNGESVRL